MEQSDLYFLKKVKEFKEIEQEFIKFTYEAKNPSNKTESEEFISKSIDLAFDAVEKRNEILGETYDVSNIQINDPELMTSAVQDKMSLSIPS